MQARDEPNANEMGYAAATLHGWTERHVMQPKTTQTAAAVGVLVRVETERMVRTNKAKWDNWRLTHAAPYRVAISATASVADWPDALWLWCMAYTGGNNIQHFNMRNMRRLCDQAIETGCVEPGLCMLCMCVSVCVCFCLYMCVCFACKQWIVVCVAIGECKTNKRSAFAADACRTCSSA